MSSTLFPFLWVHERCNQKHIELENIVSVLKGEEPSEDMDSSEDTPEWVFDEEEWILLKGHVLVEKRHCLLVVTNRRWMVFHIESLWKMRRANFFSAIVQQLPLIGGLLWSLIVRSRLRKQLRQGTLHRLMEEVMGREDDYWLASETKALVDLAYHEFFQQVGEVQVKRTRWSSGAKIVLLPQKITHLFRIPEDLWVYFEEHIPAYQRAFSALLHVLWEELYEFEYGGDEKLFFIECTDVPELDEEAAWNTELSSKQVPLWPRIRAGVSEFFILFVLLLMGAALVAYFFALATGREPEAFIDADATALTLIGTVLLLMWLYSWFMHSLSGATFGRGSVGAILLDVSGSRPSWWQAAVRPFLKFFSVVLLGVGYWPCLLGKDALHDQLLGLRVYSDTGSIQFVDGEHLT